jgi:hypothetical protein
VIVTSNGEHERVGEAFKIGNRVVYVQDVLREMNSSLSKVMSAVERLEKELNKHSDIRGTDEQSRVQRGEFEKLTEHLLAVKNLITEAKEKRTGIQQVHRQLPEDPIKRVLYSSFTQTVSEKPEWQAYQTQLHSDGAHLIVKSKKLNISNTSMMDNNVSKLTFRECNVTVAVEPLTAGGNDHPYLLSPGQTILWLGYYIFAVEQKKKNVWIVLAYFRVRSQAMESENVGRNNGMRGVPTGTTVLT